LENIGKSEKTPVAGSGQEVPAFNQVETARLWEWLLHEGNLYGNRLNFYIASQSLFFVAFASIENSIVFQTACSIAGIVLSFIWLTMSRNQVREIIRPIREILKRQHREYNYVASRRTPGMRTHNILGNILPWLMIGLWLAVTAYELFCPVAH
jgi:hypothetical protein